MHESFFFPISGIIRNNTDFKILKYLNTFSVVFQYLGSIWVFKGHLYTFNKKLSYRRGTAPRAMSVEIMLTAAQLYEKLHLKGLQ